MRAIPAAMPFGSAADKRHRVVSARRLITIGFVAVLVVLQYSLWFGSGGLLVKWELKRELAAQRDENARLRDRNRALAAEVVDLKDGLAAIEERARADLGMIKKGETFYQVIDEPKEAGDPSKRK